jgi:hypothetical protein
MNWKLIFYLSLFGLVMAIATVFWIPTNVEPFFWLVIFVVCAWYVAKECTGRYFLHGFLISLANCVWITGFHFVFSRKYLIHHPDMLEFIRQSPWPLHPRRLILVTGPAFGVFSGLVLGLFCLIASKLVKKDKAPAA